MKIIVLILFLFVIPGVAFCSDGGGGRSWWENMLILLGISIVGVLIDYVWKKTKEKTSQAISKTKEIAQEYEKKKCPYCAEKIKKEAIYCKYCKHDLN